MKLSLIYLLACMLLIGCASGKISYNASASADSPIAMQNSTSSKASVSTNNSKKSQKSKEDNKAGTSDSNIDADISIEGKVSVLQW